MTPEELNLLHRCADWFFCTALIASVVIGALASACFIQEDLELFKTVGLSRGDMTTSRNPKMTIDNTVWRLRIFMYFSKVSVLAFGAFILVALMVCPFFFNFTF